MTPALALPISRDGEPMAVGQAVFRLPRKRTDVSVTLFSGPCSGYFSVSTDVPRTFQILQGACHCIGYICMFATNVAYTVTPSHYNNDLFYIIIACCYYHYRHYYYYYLYNSIIIIIIIIIIITIIMLMDQESCAEIDPLSW